MDKDKYISELEKEISHLKKQFESDYQLEQIIGKIHIPILGVNKDYRTEIINKAF